MKNFFMMFLIGTCIFFNASAQPGAIDLTFNPTDQGFGDLVSNGVVNSIAIQSDGKILIGGSFTSYNGRSRNRIARLNSDGSLDTGFDPGTGANNWINSVALQSDGKILVGGGFTSYNGTSRNRIARLNPDGSIDTGFDPGTGASSYVNSIAIQSDGKVLIGGDFTSYNGTFRNYIARLNSDGSLDTGFNPGTGATNTVYSIAVQSDGKILIGGYFISYDGTSRNRIARLNSDGSLDTGFDPGTGANATVLSITVQTDGKILIGGFFTSYNGTSIKSIARLNSDGSLDSGFNPGTGTDYWVYSIAVQSDGKILIGGSFTIYNGTSRIRIARLNPDGSLDTGFDPGTGADGVINSIVVQSNGKILIGGFFTSYMGTSKNYIASLNSDGSLDTGFAQRTGADSYVNSIAVQSDGKILIGGYFTSYNGTSRNRIARLNSDGNLDTGFDPGTGANATVLSIAVQSDGKILIGGYFTSYNGTSRNYITRLNSDGSLDTGFNPGTGANVTIYSIAVQGDGKILIGGNFTSYNGTSRKGIARLNSNGSLDTGFNPGTGTSAGIGVGVNSIAVQSDGKILIGGDFTSYNGTSRNRIARLNSDGSLDTGFNPGTGASGSDVYSIAVQSDGKILIGGNFTSYNGTSRNRIARLNSDGSLDTGFNPASGASGTVFSIAVQGDGKVLIGGDFTYYNGTSRKGIARLHSEGCLDTGFDPGTGATNTVYSNIAVYSIVVQSDGKILIGGDFTSYNGTGRNRIARIMGGTLAPEPEINVKAGTTSVPSGASVGFGSVNIGADSTITFTIVNLGNADLNLTGTPKIAVSGTDAADFTVNETATSSPVASGGSTTFTVTFAPSSSGAKSATITIANDDICEGTYVINLTGQEPEINVKAGSTSVASTGSFGFGSVNTGANSTVTFSIENLGIGDLNLSGIPKIAVSGTAATDFTVNVTATTSPVAAGSSTTFTVTFAPSSAGTKSATITIANNDTDESVYTIYLTGTATSTFSPEINIRQGSTNIASSQTYDFGSVTTVAYSTITFTIENSGNSVLNLTYFTMTGTHTTDFTMNLTGTYPTIAAGGSTTFAIIFTPFSAGVKSAVITIANNDADEGSYVINLTGTGTAATGLFGSASANSFEALVGPNPSNGIYNINTSEKIDEVIVSDCMGNILLNNSDSQIDLSNQPSGVYFLTIISGEKRFFGKLVKN